MNNRITQLFERKKKDILSVYFTSGFPNLDDTDTIIRELADAGADMIEIGIPFSDPIADGSTIQASNMVALNNGITLEKIFAQLKDIREQVDIPLLLMGYINPVLQYGIEKFCEDAEKTGIDGIILPDLPMAEYEALYKERFEQHRLSNIFLVTPQTSEARIRKIDALSNGFIYVVSSASTTGKTSGFGEEHFAYFQKIEQLNLNNPTLVGFGISNPTSFQQAARHTNGAIIGSAFIKAIDGSTDLRKSIQTFVHFIKGNPELQTTT